MRQYLQNVTQVIELTSLCNDSGGKALTNAPTSKTMLTKTLYNFQTVASI